MQELVIANGTVVTMGEKNRLLPKSGLVIRDGRIIEINEVGAFIGKYAGARFVDARGGLIMPGFINAHSHFYGAFARGMALRGDAPADFGQILESVWWRLDRALSAEDVRSSALLGLIDCIRYGTTTVFDHHASPNAVNNSLDLIADSVIKAGLRGCLSYEVSDRDGKDIAKKGIAENKRFIEKVKADNQESRLAAAFGLHASFTVDNDTLTEAAAVCEETNTSVHVNLAESSLDVDTSMQKYGKRPLERLMNAGLLKRPGLLAHGVHLNEAEQQVVASTRSWLLHNPESNMNNAVGTAPIAQMLKNNAQIALGTDGMTANMQAEMRAAGLSQRASSKDPRMLDFGQIHNIALRNNAIMAEQFFGLPLGVLKNGAAGDVIIVNYHPPTPMNENTFLAHLLFGIINAPVLTTIANGRILMENGKLTTLDEVEIAARARELSPKVWQRLE